MKIAKVNIVGPEGESVLRDEPIPGDWPDWFVDSLLESGGVADVPDPDEEES